MQLDDTPGIETHINFILKQPHNLIRTLIDDRNIPQHINQRKPMHEHNTLPIFLININPNPILKSIQIPITKMITQNFILKIFDISLKIKNIICLDLLFRWSLFYYLN